jgi:hypothetical protein
LLADKIPHEAATGSVLILEGIVIPARAGDRFVRQVEFQRYFAFFIRQPLPIFGLCKAHSHLLAMIVVVPAAIPVANPPTVIETIEGSELLHVTDEVMSIPRLSRALNCT